MAKKKKKSSAEREMQLSRGMRQIGAQDCYSDRDKMFCFMKVFHPHLTDRQLLELVSDCKE